ncbi:hypothetical protein QQF64_028105 [Cirrhinus molitorella]|uniref:Uncharacterized protein n=1 Tax=Cirrhinus molitorella TaxID=172907 RepID=A0ABR3N600_9TELE
MIRMQRVKTSCKARPSLKPESRAGDSKECFCESLSRGCVVSVSAAEVQRDAAGIRRHTRLAPRRSDWPAFDRGRGVCWLSHQHRWSACQLIF